MLTSVLTIHISFHVMRPEIVTLDTGMFSFQNSYHYVVFQSLIHCTCAWIHYFYFESPFIHASTLEELEVKWFKSQMQNNNFRGSSPYSKSAESNAQNWVLSHEKVFK